MPALQIVPNQASTPPPIVAPNTASPPPTSPPGKPRRKTREPLHLEYDELARLFHVIESPRDRAIFRVAYHAGLRASEVGHLELRDYNQRTERIAIHRLKGSNSGDHHCAREESRALHAWLKVRGSLPGPLFPSNRRTGIDRKTLDKLMKKYGAMAGLPAKLRHFHIFKHSCATHLLDKGFNIEQVQDWLGHVNIQSTLVYAKITNRRRQEMADELADWK